MKIQEALDTIDEMITAISNAQESYRERSTCSDSEYYERLDAEHDAKLDKYRNLRDAIERGLDY